ncbi:hypothetical protein RZN25_14245 [Bacillaceae bacterium S4-13-56]
MLPSTFSLKDRKHVISLEPIRMTCYANLAIVEASHQQSLYYLFFLDNEFLTALKTNKIKKDTFLERAWKEGIILTAPHPLITKRLSDHSLHNTSFQGLLNQILSSKQDAAKKVLTLFIFDNYIDNEKLNKRVKSIYYNSRRDGKLKDAYRILKYVQLFTVSSHWSYEYSADLDYSSYEKHYISSSQQSSKDTLYWIWKNFQNRDEMFSSLLSIPNVDPFYSVVWSYDLILSHKNDDYLSAFLDKISSFPKEDQYALVRPLLSLDFKNETWISHASQLLLDLEKVNDFLELLSQNKLSLSHEHGVLIRQILREKPMLIEKISTNHTSQYLIPLYIDFKRELEGILQDRMEKFISTAPLDQIPAWIKSYQEFPSILRPIHEFYSMIKYLNDPDHQLDLGKVYASFHRYDDAIECFSFEMELNPTDPEPIQWLAKIYQEKGLKEESKAYQQLYSQVANMN